MHIGIILDGNRRFAKRILKNLGDGHKQGARKVEELLEWCIELEIKQITLYCFSLENFNREKEEINFLMELFKKEFKKLGEDERIKKNQIRIRFVGERERLDDELREIITHIEKKTKEYNNYRLNFALAYGGRQEILSTIKRMIKRDEEINEENFSKSLWLNDEPDLIIRTGGEKRTSNFLLWQSIYSEWIFLDKMWPEFTKKDLKDAIKEFKNRKRRFGK